MMKEEFCNLIGNDNVTPEQYEVIETVYSYYPDKAGSTETVTKQEYASLYLKFGFRIFESMLPLANEIRKREDMIRQKQKDILQIESELQKLKKNA